LRKRFNIG